MGRVLIFIYVMMTVSVSSCFGFLAATFQRFRSNIHYPISMSEQADTKYNEHFGFGECKLVEVCTMEKYCKRKGSPRIWKLFQELAPQAGIHIDETECFFECQTGPNARLDGDNSRIIGGIDSEEMVRKVLGLPPLDADSQKDTES